MNRFRLINKKDMTSMFYGESVVTQAELNTLMTISENDSRIGVLASSVLSGLGYIDYEEPIYQMDDDGFKRQNNKPSRRIADEIDDNLKLYPNPAKDYITMEYNAEGLGKELMMTITNMDGKVIKIERLVNEIDSRNVDIKRLVSGNYILDIVSEGKTVYSKKFVIK